MDAKAENVKERSGMKRIEMNSRRKWADLKWGEGSWMKTGKLRRGR